MSELKVYHHELRHNEYEEFYLKYEADKVILILQDRFAVKIEKDEPYVGDYGLTVSDNEDECEFTVAINYCPICGRKLTNQSTAQQGKG